MCMDTSKKIKRNQLRHKLRIDHINTGEAVTLKTPLLTFIVILLYIELDYIDFIPV